MNMKFGIILLATIFQLQTVRAEKLVCYDSSFSYRSFEVTLDHSKFDPGTPYFDLKDPKFNDIYYYSDNLSCVGHQVDTIACIGFLNQSPDQIVRLKILLDSQTISVGYAIQNEQNGKFENKTIPCKIVN